MGLKALVPHTKSRFWFRTSITLMKFRHSACAGKRGPSASVSAPQHQPQKQPQGKRGSPLPPSLREAELGEVGVGGSPRGHEWDLEIGFLADYEMCLF